MDHNRNGAESVAWSALFILVLRAVSVCVFLFVSINWDILLRSSIQVHACSGATSSTPSARCSRSNPARNDTRENERECTSAIPQRSLDRAVKTPDPTETPGHSSYPQDSNNQTSPPPPPPYSFSPSTLSQSKPSVDTIVRLYEDIMASDSQTIEVQQRTLCSQQDIIRSQSQVIRKMRQVLEDQDARIEELEGRLGGLARI